MTEIANRLVLAILAMQIHEIYDTTSVGQHVEKKTNLNEPLHLCQNVSPNHQSVGGAG